MIASVSLANQVELAIVAGTPDQSFSFVKNILKSRVKLVGSGDTGISKFTSQIFYFAERAGIQSAASVEVLKSTGGTTLQLVLDGVRSAAPNSKIILLSVGPILEVSCVEFKKYPNTVFLALVTIGELPYDEARNPSCSSPNILYVAGLNENLTDLQNQKLGASILRLAVPATNMQTPLGVRSSRTFGMALVAGRMASMMRENPALKGKELVDLFLVKETDFLPAIADRVVGGKAFVRF